jgi:hypothetical protein
MEFSFNFFGSIYRRVYISSDGAILLSRPSSLCLQNGAYLSFTNRSQCALNVMAAGMTALDMRPVNASNQVHDIPVLAYQSNTSHVIVRWQYARLYMDPLYVNTSSPSYQYAARVRQTMEIIIAADNTITTTLYNVTDVSSLPGAGYQRQLLIGIQQYGKLASLPFDAGSNELQYYPLSLPYQPLLMGEYPSRSQSLINSASRTSYCRVSYTSCISPRRGTPLGGTLVKIFMPDFECQGVISSLWVSFGGIRTIGLWNDTSLSLDTFSPAGINNTLTEVTVWNSAVGGYRVASIGVLLYYTFGYDTPIGSNSSISDVLVHCRDCGVYSPSYCPIDCHGTYGGEAYNDTCGKCCGGTTGVTCNVDVDCDGNCFGPMVIYHSSNDPSTTFCGCNSLLINQYLCERYSYLSGPTGIGATTDPFIYYQLVVLSLLSFGSLAVLLSFLLYTSSRRCYRYWKMRRYGNGEAPLSVAASSPASSASLPMVGVGTITVSSHVLPPSSVSVAQDNIGVNVPAASNDEEPGLGVAAVAASSSSPSNGSSFVFPRLHQ